MPFPLFDFYIFLQSLVYVLLFYFCTTHEKHFNDKIPHDFPPNKYVDIRQSYYDKGIEYLNNIDLDLDRYEILGVEKEIH